MARAALRQVILCVTASGLLLGCVEGAGPKAGSGTQATVAPAVTRAGSGREVEAPDVFQVTDSALWDGRPSLGGIWVASPNVTDPERVVMVNPANGKTVNGALFRRERDNPGPTLQVSSDAAEALGMLAGQPTELRVTALRKPAEAAPAVAPPVAVAAATDGAAGAPAETAPVADGSAAETAALATAALAATDAAPEAAVAATDGAVEAVAPEAPKRKTWKERRAEAKAKREAEKAAKAAAAAGVAPVEAADSATDATGSEAAAPAATADEAAVATVETAPLDARTPEVAAEAAAAAAGTEAAPAPEPKKKTRRQIREEEKAAKAAAAEAAVAAEAAKVEGAEAGAAAPPAEAGAGRQIQVASFSKEENAKRAVEALAKIGVTAAPQKSEKDGKAVWGVVATGDDALLASIKKAGFADAFYLN